MRAYILLNNNKHYVESISWNKAGITNICIYDETGKYKTIFHGARYLDDNKHGLRHLNLKEVVKWESADEDYPSTERSQ